ncbi:hypothetical protein HaLaN_02160 [Haematococcus lacustris]|uniref:Uncharacterized protein n=1 Tax=Haematococcus lacustris TaxID=44745 RepID=A0A699YWE3_HAELA|nr:hypothetical protein HaLaN_02160 [Haematococcus lacustris]
MQALGNEACADSGLAQATEGLEQEALPNLEAHSTAVGHLSRRGGPGARGRHSWLQERLQT